MPEGSELQYEGQVLRLRGSTLVADALQNLRSAARAAGFQVLTVGDALEIRPEARGQVQPAAQSQPASTTPAASPAAPAAPAAVVSRLSSFIWQT